MAGISLADAEAKLALYMAAEERVLAGQSYTIGGRTLNRANLKEIQDGIDTWDKRVKRLFRGGARMRQAVPVGN